MSNSGSSPVLEPLAEATKREKIEYVKQIIRENVKEYTKKYSAKFRNYNNLEEDIDIIAKDFLVKMPLFYATSITPKALKDNIDAYFLHHTLTIKGGRRKSRKNRRKSKKSRKHRRKSKRHSRR